jgi:hypothetical protein
MQDGMPIGLSYPHAIDVGIRREGSVALWINSPNPGWDSDNNGYNFGPAVRAEGINLVVFKTPDRRISITISGPLGRTFQFNQPMPPAARPEGVFVAVTWTVQSVVLYLNGAPAVTVDPTSAP